MQQLHDGNQQIPQYNVVFWEDMDIIWMDGYLIAS